MLNEGQGVITEFRHIRHALISHLYDALGQDRLRRERLRCFREVAAKTLQECPSLIERIADRACLAKLKRQQIFNDDANSSRPTCFGARAEGRSKGCDAVDERPGRFAMAARSLRGYVRHSRKSSYSFVTIRKLLTTCGARMPLTGAEYR